MDTKYVYSHDQSQRPDLFFLVSGKNWQLGNGELERILFIWQQQQLSCWFCQMLVIVLAASLEDGLVKSSGPCFYIPELRYPNLEVAEEANWAELIQGATGVVNLAGLPISRRWTPEVNSFCWHFFCWKLHFYSIEQIGGKEGAHVFRRTISKKHTHSEQLMPNCGRWKQRSRTAE